MKRRRVQAAVVATAVVVIVVAVVGYSALLSDLLTTSVARAGTETYIFDERRRRESYDFLRWKKNRRQRRKENVFMEETQQQNLQRRRQQQQSIEKTTASPSQTLPQQLHRTLETKKYLRQPTNACHRAAEIYAMDGAQCACTGHPDDLDTVTFDCYFPGCEECAERWSRDDLVCAELSTRTVVSNLDGENEPYEVSYTECFTYTRGRSNTVCYTEFAHSQPSLNDEQCLLDVNGVHCNACQMGTCISDEDGMKNVGLSKLDCSNIVGGYNWNLCNMNNGVFDIRISKESVLLAFADVKTFSFDKCFSNRIIGEGKLNKENTPESMPQVSKPQSGQVCSFHHGTCFSIFISIPTFSHNFYFSSPSQRHPSQLPDYQYPLEKNNVFDHEKGSKGNIFKGMENVKTIRPITTYKVKWEQKAPNRRI